MVRLPKYYLKLIVLLVLIASCNNEEASATLKRERAEQIYAEAIRFYQGTAEFQNGIIDAIKVDPTYDEAIRELSIAYLKRGIPHEWKTRIDIAVKLNPIQWQGYRGYNYLWFYRDYKKAIADFDATDTLTPNFIDAPQGHSVDYWRGIAYLGLEDYENALAYFNKFITTETEAWSEDLVEVTAFLYRGIVLLETGEREKALKDFDKVLFYNREHSADAKYYKALILKDADPIKAKTLIEAAIEDFNNGYYNQRPYVETMRQIYIQDLEALNDKIQEKLNLSS